MQEMADLIPESGKSPGEGNGNSLQYSCLGNPTDRGAWRATAYGAARESDKTQRQNSNKQQKQQQCHGHVHNASHLTGESLAMEPFSYIHSIPHIPSSPHPVFEAYRPRFIYSASASRATLQDFLQSLFEYKQIIKFKKSPSFLLEPYPEPRPIVIPRQWIKCSQLHPPSAKLLCDILSITTDVGTYLEN